MDRRLDSETRKTIYGCIAASPGLHFREIQRRLNLGTGTLDYHLHLLRRQGSIRAEKSGKFTRYYTTDKLFEEKEKSILNLLRNENFRHIVIYLLEHRNPSASEISSALGFSPSRLSWHLKTLLGSNVVEQKKNGRHRFYSLKSPKDMAGYLKAHRASFLDGIVDRFIDAWASE